MPNIKASKISGKADAADAEEKSSTTVRRNLRSRVIETEQPTAKPVVNLSDEDGETDEKSSDATEAQPESESPPKSGNKKKTDGVPTTTVEQVYDDVPPDAPLVEKGSGDATKDVSKEGTSAATSAAKATTTTATATVTKATLTTIKPGQPTAVMFTLPAGQVPPGASSSDATNKTPTTFIAMVNGVPAGYVKMPPGMTASKTPLTVADPQKFVAALRPSLPNLPILKHASGPNLHKLPLATTLPPVWAPPLPGLHAAPVDPSKVLAANSRAILQKHKSKKEPAKKPIYTVEQYYDMVIYWYLSDKTVPGFGYEPGRREKRTAWVRQQLSAKYGDQLMSAPGDKTIRDKVRSWEKGESLIPKNMGPKGTGGRPPIDKQKMAETMRGVLTMCAAEDGTVSLREAAAKSGYNMSSVLRMVEAGGVDDILMKTSVYRLRPAVTMNEDQLRYREDVRKRQRQYAKERALNLPPEQRMPRKKRCCRSLKEKWAAEKAAARASGQSDPNGADEPMSDSDSSSSVASERETTEPTRRSHSVVKTAAAVVRRRQKESHQQRLKQRLQQEEQNESSQAEAMAVDYLVNLNQQTQTSSTFTPSTSNYHQQGGYYQ